MLRHARFTASILLVSFAGACSSESATVAGPAFDTDEAVAARFGASAADSKARMTVYLAMPDGEATGFRGDGRLANGASSAGGPSVYDGGLCGVSGKIFWYDTRLSRSGDAVFDPDKDRSRCGSARKLSIAPFGLVGPSMNFRAIMQVAEGDSRSHQLNMTLGIASCYALRYSADYGSAVRVTRISGNTSGVVGQWVALSEGSHRAGCYTFKKGVYTPTGVSYYLPLHVLIDELR